MPEAINTLIYNMLLPYFENNSDGVKIIFLALNMKKISLRPYGSLPSLKSWQEVFH
jgi:hypothetical protein